VRTGRLLGKKVSALITSMEEPLGHAVGNSVEIVECIEVLKGGGPEDLKVVSLALAAEMLMLAGAAPSEPQALKMLDEKIISGEGLDKLKEIIRAQGGKAEIVEEDLLLPQASRRYELRAPRKGYIAGIKAEPVGKAAMLLGAGRETVESVIDHAAAVWLRKKRGEQVEAGDPLCTLEFNDDRRLQEAIALAAGAFEIGDAQPSKLDLILERITE